MIVDKIDKDADGFVSREELKDWIQYTQKRYITDDVERQWKAHNPENKDKLSWEEYKKMVYGFMDGKKTVISDDKIFPGNRVWQFDVDVRCSGECACLHHQELMLYLRRSCTFFCERSRCSKVIDVEVLEDPYSLF